MTSNTQHEYRGDGFTHHDEDDCVKKELTSNTSDELRAEIEDGLIRIDQHVSDNAIAFIADLITLKQREARIETANHINETIILPKDASEVDTVRRLTTEIDDYTAQLNNLKGGK